MGAKCSSSCFGSAMEAEASEMGCKSESVWSSFKGRLKQKNENQSSKPVAFSNYAAQISPVCLISGKSDALVSIVSISRGGEFVPLILSPVGKAMSNERQPTQQKTHLRFDAAEIEVKSRDPNISVKSNNGPKVSQDRLQRSHTKDTKIPVIEQTKAQDRILQKKEVADSIPVPIEHLSKSSGTSVTVDSKRSKLSKFVNFPRKVSSHATKRQGIKSTTLSQLLRPGVNRTTGNFQRKKINSGAERKGTVTCDARKDGVGYSMAINLCILIIIMACLVVFSNRLLAVLCTSIGWYLLPTLLEKKRTNRQKQQQLDALTEVDHIRC